MQDVRNNMAGGTLLRSEAVNHPGLSGIEESLAQRRTYIVSISVTSSTTIRQLFARSRELMILTS